MARKAFLEGDDAEEFRRLYDEFCDAVAHAGSILKSEGMNSEAFRQADAAAGKIQARLRELQDRGATFEEAQRPHPRASVAPGI